MFRIITAIALAISISPICSIASRCIVPGSKWAEYEDENSGVVNRVRAGLRNSDQPQITPGSGDLVSRIETRLLELCHDNSDVDLIISCLEMGHGPTFDPSDTYIDKVKELINLIRTDQNCTSLELSNLDMGWLDMVLVGAVLEKYSNITILNLDRF